VERESREKKKRTS